MSVRSLAIIRKRLVQTFWTTELIQQTKRCVHKARKAPEKKPPNRLVDVALLVVPITTFGLGCWQIKRKELKEALLKKIKDGRAAPTIPLPEDLSDLVDLEYRSVRVRGEFIHDRELILAPRKKEVENEERWLAGEDGANIITPLMRSDTGELILINRGWVDKQHMWPEQREKGQITGEVELSGMLRLPSKRIYNMKDKYVQRKNGFFTIKDVPLMSEVGGTLPVLIDADPESTVKGGPIGGQYRVFFRNEHLQYIFTWFGISAASSYLWLRNFRR